MARVKENYEKPTNTVIGKGFTIQAARLTGSESIRVDGTVIGNIDLDGYLQLSDTGGVEGDVHVSHANIAGRVSGNILCRALLHLCSTAVVNGDIITATVIIDEGAVLHGRLMTRDSEPVPIPLD